MFGTILLKQLFGREAVDSDYALALGRRLGRREHYIATRLKVMDWSSKEQWDEMREWLLTDLKGEDPLPPRQRERPHGAN